MKHINTPSAPAAIGPYSHAVVVNGMVYTSGQVAMNPETKELVTSGVADETHQVMKNLEAILKEVGTSFDKVIKATIFLQNMDDFPTVNEIYGSYLTEGKFPARETVQVARLPRNVNVEISMIALV
ncbi:RidA family protein [Weeksellaceae bacterium KMM 9713]|uniref:RidA family protein n=1 Tax=Profundicola chukchiensis TaxID=2961959 RepID=A0A9X4MWA8_9FLAO|nr:RidA family protein [Profundicola chukchiensis]MDG4946056.1 RidA family protein [Profundicola chukchiensis]